MKQRFLTKVNKTDGCWNWTAHKDKDGYGRFRIDGKIHRAHRVSYELYKGEITKGLVVRHSCDNTSCVNPDHLEVGTVQDNTDDMMKRGRQAIQKGEKNGNVKLTENDVLEIRQWLEFGYTVKVIAEMFGVSIRAIYGIRSRKNWSHL